MRWQSSGVGVFRARETPRCDVGWDRLSRDIGARPGRDLLARALLIDALVIRMRGF